MPATGSPLAGVTARFPASPEGLAELHAAFDRFFVAAEGAGAGILAADRAAIITAAAEIAANIVAHACQKLPDAEVQVALSRRRDRIEMHFEDPGIPCPEPEDREAHETVVPHLGIGLSVARASVDALEYKRQADTNHWRLMRLTPS